MTERELELVNITMSAAAAGVLLGSEIMVRAYNLPDVVRAPGAGLALAAVVTNGTVIAREVIERCRGRDEE